MLRLEHFNVSRGVATIAALRFAIIITTCVTLVPGAEPPMTREGPYWVRVVTASEPVTPATRLKVTSRGAVTVSGNPQNFLSYALKIKVKAPNKEQAERIARAFSVRSVKSSNNYATLVVQRGDGMADLLVKVPRTSPEATITTTEGPLEFFDLDGSVHGETGGGSITADRIGGNLVARTAGGDIKLGTVDGTARCVTAGGKITAGRVRGEVNFETGGGDIFADEVGSMAQVSTQAGTILIKRAGSAVIASTGGGRIDVGQAGGLVTAKNSGGPVKVGSAKGVRCENAGGGVNLVNISGGVRVTTAIGNIMASLLGGKPMSDSFLSTGSGDITVFIPSNLGVTIRAQNELADNMRRIISDFPGISVHMEGGQLIAEGPVNGGGPVLRISGDGGTIFIKKQQ